MREVALIIKEYLERGYRTAAIVSAMGNTTNDLLALAGGVTDELSGREIDQLLATGEQQSIALLAMALKREGIPAQSFTAAQAGFFANGFPTEGRIYRVAPKAVTDALEHGMVAVVAGFQAVTDQGDVITLGRGGSDLSAVALAAAIGGECHILKDVPGVMSADPKIVRSPEKLDYLSYQECMELSSLGAKMLQARSAEVAARYEVPLYIASSFTKEEGTWIMKNIPVSEGLIVKAVVHDLKVAKVVLMGVPDVPGVAGRLFSNLAERGVGAEMIIQNTMRGGLNDIGFLVRKENLDEAIDVCRNFSAEVDAQGVSFNTEIARVSIVGSGIANHPDIPSRMFTILAKESINIEMIASTALAVTCVVAATRAEDAVRALHEHFIEEEAV
jgi:aspartate kinase